MSIRHICLVIVTAQVALLIHFACVHFHVGHWRYFLCFLLLIALSLWIARVHLKR